MKRLPAEWEAQSHVMLTWPNDRTDWAAIMDRVQPVYENILRALCKHVPVVIAADVFNAEEVRAIAARCATGGAHPVQVFTVPIDDTWARDHGPITVIDKGKKTLLDFTFNGWGNKFDAARDNAISHALHSQGAFGDCALTAIEMVLEGGAIESDGRGCLLTTAPCLLNPNRNPNLNADQIEASLREHFGVEKILWLRHGYLAGDDTDSHVDTLARLAPDNAIVYVSIDDESDEHYAELKAMEAELLALKTLTGEPFQLIPLPFPKAIYDDEGQRLPATYANYLITNGAVLVPVYGDAKDQFALSQIARAYPDREIIGIDCRPLIVQHGSLHCITMQIPA